MGHLRMPFLSCGASFELALIGATTEGVARHIQEGQFGLWEETGRINEAIWQGANDGLGLGEAVGRMIEEGRFPHRDVFCQERS
jgi:hypothetical protein